MSGFTFGGVKAMARSLFERVARDKEYTWDYKPGGPEGERLTFAFSSREGRGAARIVVDITEAEDILGALQDGLDRTADPRPETMGEIIRRTFSYDPETREISFETSREEHARTVRVSPGDCTGIVQILRGLIEQREEAFAHYRAISK